MKETPPENLASRIERARRLALSRLLEIRSSEGTWGGAVEGSAFESAVFIIMLRTTGLIERPNLAAEEAGLIEHLVRQVNPDGGFFKYPGSPSCRGLTRLAAFSLRLGAGDIPPSHRPSRWFGRNPSLTVDLLFKVRQVLEGTSAFLHRNGQRTWSAFELAPSLIEKLLTAYADPRKTFVPTPYLEPGLQVRLNRSPVLARIHRSVHFMNRKALPGLAILNLAIAEKRPVFRTLMSLRRVPGPLLDTRRTAVKELSRLLLAEQEPSGSWSLSPFYTMLNVMALQEAGLSSRHPAVERALSFLRGDILAAEEGGSCFPLVHTDIWDTALALGTILGVPGATAEDEWVRPGVVFLLANQGDGGGFSMASSAGLDADVDSTALVLRVLSQASRTAGGELNAAIALALRKGLPFLLGRQYRGGGYSAFDGSLFKGGKRGAHGFFLQGVFDAPTADLTARVLFALAELGMTSADEPIARGLRFLLRNQCRNGAWWSRWWAGYIAGTDFVLDALGRLGFRYGYNPYSRDQRAYRTQQAMMRGIAFLLQHQNADGGWGETVWSDFSLRHAGKGASRPLHTASALFDLLLCGIPVDSAPVRRGYEFLLAAMSPEGRWRDGRANFTVVPRAQYYAYPFLNYILPLSALNAYLKAAGILTGFPAR